MEETQASKPIAMDKKEKEKDKKIKEWKNSDERKDTIF